MSVESVGYCTGGSPHRALPEILFRQEQVFSYSPKTPASIQQRDMSADHCFHCKQKGHWARDCPQKSHGTPGPQQSSTPDKNLSPKYPQQQYPELICKCNRPCAVKTSQTISNPGRDFYTCANPIKEQCGFFSWCDNASKLLVRGANSPAKPDQQPGNKPQRPECLCRAGPCRIETVKEEGDLKGFKYYVCHLKKGQGACIHKVYITDMNMNRASNEMHLNCYQTTEEPNDKRMVYHGTMKDENRYTSKEKDPPTFSPTTPRSEHEVKHLQCGSPPMKRLNFLEGSSVKLNCVEERLNDAESAQVNCSAVNKASLTEAGEGKPVRCVVCGEEGHEGQGACIHKVYITDMNLNHASNEMHLNCYQTTEEPNNKGMVYHGTMKDENCYTSKEKDPPAFSPTTPRSEHEVKHLQCGSPPVKRLNFLEGSSVKLNCVEERLNDAESAQVNCSAVNKASLTEAGEGKPVRCVVCGEEGHEVSECIAVAMW